MYKVINDSKIIDVVKNPKFLRFLSSGFIALTDKSSAHGILGYDNTTIYSFGKVSYPGAKTVSIEKISEKEFNRLLNILNSGQEIVADESALDNAKQNKINQLSAICKEKITSGFSVVLLDNKSYSFRLTPEDQLNLLSLENQLNAGEITFIYHATDKPCQIFVRQDMLKIISAFRKHITYHTTYFNTAKHYITSLNDFNKINDFEYGKDVTYTVKDLALRNILKDGGAN